MDANVSAITALMDAIDSVALDRLRHEDSGVGGIDNNNPSARGVPGDNIPAAVIDQDEDPSEGSNGEPGRRPAYRTSFSSASEQAATSEEAANGNQTACNVQAANDNGGLSREPPKNCKYGEAVQPMCTKGVGLGTCPICMQDYDDGQAVAVIARCGHVFCKDCLESWMEHNKGLSPGCPTGFCRTQIGWCWVGRWNEISQAPSDDGILMAVVEE